MNEIKCPNCGEVFKVDESGFADIVKQVRDREFKQEVESRVALLESNKKNEISLAVESAKSAALKDLSDKNLEIAGLRAQVEAFSTKQQLAVAEAVAAPYAAPIRAKPVCCPIVVPQLVGGVLVAV